MNKSLQFSVFLILSAFTASYAQFNPVWTVNYQHTSLNDFSNESRKVVSDASGNAYVLADVTSNLDPQGLPTVNTYHYTVLSKYNSAGSLIHSRNIDVVNHIVSGEDNKGAFGMEIDASSNIYIGYITYNATTNFDVNITKYNSSLVRLWVRTYNPTSSDAGVDMGLSSTGDVFALVKSVSGANTTNRIIFANGQLTDDVDLYSFTANTDVMNAVDVKAAVVYVTGYTMVSGAKNVLTVKINSQGVLKWSNVFNGGSVGNDDSGNGLVLAPDGYLYVVGTSNRGAPSWNDAMVVKHNATNGNRIWVKYKDFNNGISDAGKLIQAPDVNNIYIASVSGNSIYMDQLDAAMGNAGGRAIYAPLPVAAYMSLNGASLTDFRVSTGNAFYLTGGMTATDLSNRLFSAQYLVKLVFAPAGSRDAFKLDAAMPVDGDFVSSRCGTSISLDYSQSNVYWLCDMFSPYTVHTVEKVVLSNIDMTSPIRLSYDKGASNRNVDNILITPNPTNSVIKVSASENIRMMEIYDLTGKNVKTINVTSSNIIADLSSLNRGIYIGKIYLNSGVITTRKIIKN